MDDDDGGTTSAPVLDDGAAFGDVSSLVLLHVTEELDDSPLESAVLDDGEEAVDDGDVDDVLMPVAPMLDEDELVIEGCIPPLLTPLLLNADEDGSDGPIQVVTFGGCVTFALPMTVTVI